MQHAVGEVYEQSCLGLKVKIKIAECSQQVKRVSSGSENERQSHRSEVD